MELKLKACVQSKGSGQEIDSVLAVRVSQLSWEGQWIEGQVLMRIPALASTHSSCRREVQGHWEAAVAVEQNGDLEAA